MVFAIAGYFIWPHVFTDAKVVLEGINDNPPVFFMKLDPVVLVGTLLQLPVWLALWVALKKNRFWIVFAGTVNWIYFNCGSLNSQAID